MDEPSYRVSDAERDQAVISLREHLVAGRLTLEEFSERVDIALRAAVVGDLARAHENLPAVLMETVSVPRRPIRVTFALFAHVIRRGRLGLRKRNLVVSILSDIDLDLREATIDGPRAAVVVLTMLGNVDVYVPEGVNVEIGGITIFGHRRDWGRDVARQDAPTVHVIALGCFGTIDVWRVPSDVGGDYGDIARGVKKQLRKNRKPLRTGGD